MKTLSMTTQKNALKALRLIGFAMILCFGSNNLSAQSNERTVTGVVNSMDGPLLGATVILKGTAIAVTSTENGSFTFPSQLKENDVLLVSYLGYESDEIKISEDTTFIEPFLEDIPIIIVASLRTSNTVTLEDATQN